MRHEILSFHPEFAGLTISDLLRRLESVRWNDAVTDDWRYGTRKSLLESVVAHWRQQYDFAAAAKRLGAWNHFRAAIDGFNIHFIRIEGRKSKSTPLLLLNGWPSSFVEYGKLGPRLADPAAFGDPSSDAFDIVIPTLPGFGFSDRPVVPYQVDAVEAFHHLMTEILGYRRFLAVGTDIGAGVATRLALKYPESVLGIHIASVVDPPVAAEDRPLTDAEKAYRVTCQRWNAEEGAYQHLQSTRPQTVGFALADSPVGLASWILEKFNYWSDHNGNLLEVFPADMLIDNLMVYWVTGTIGSSMRLYYDSKHYRAPISRADHVGRPTAVCMWPKDLVVAPREWAERFYDVRQYSLQRRGGHFPAWEAPDDYAADIRRFVRTL